jgi:hypothetical protein
MSVRNVRAANILADFPSVPQSRQANAGMAPKIGHDRFLSYSLQFNTYKDSTIQLHRISEESLIKLTQLPFIYWEKNLLLIECLLLQNEYIYRYIL